MQRTRVVDRGFERRFTYRRPERYLIGRTELVRGVLRIKDFDGFIPKYAVGLTLVHRHRAVVIRQKIGRVRVPVDHTEKCGDDAEKERHAYPEAPGEASAACAS